MSNITNIINQVNFALSNNPLIAELAPITSIINAIDKSNYTVYGLNDLPSASSNTGRLMYVSSLNKFYYSDGKNWATEGPLGTFTGGTYVFGNNPSAVYLFYGNQKYTINFKDPVLIENSAEVWSKFSTNHAIKTDGTLWNFSSLYNPNEPNSMYNIPGTWIDITEGGTSSLLNFASIKADGTLWTWGNNAQGQLGNGTTVSRTSPGTTTGGGTNWSQVSSGLNSTASIKTDGTLWTWGLNTDGNLGDGTTTGRSSPGTTAGGGTNWSQVSAGTSHVVAIKTDGTLWTWGSNTSGQLGNGTTTGRSSPGTTAGGGTNWSQVSSGLNSTASIKTDGTLWTWGANSNGELGTGNTTSRSSPGTTSRADVRWTSVFISKASIFDEKFTVAIAE